MRGTTNPSTCEGNIVLADTAAVSFTCSGGECPQLVVNGDIDSNGLLTATAKDASSLNLIDIRGKLAGSFAFSYVER